MPWCSRTFGLTPPPNTLTYSPTLKFQVPWLPEFVLSRGDGSAIKNMFLGPTMGVKRRSGPFAVTDGDVDVYVHALSKPGALTAALNWYRQLADLTNDDFRTLPPTELCPLRAPVLVLWGTEDGALSNDLTRGEERFCANGYTLKRLEGCSHWVLEDHADEALTAIGDFIGSVPFSGRREP